MSTLKNEISLNRDYQSNSEESLLNIVYTNLCLNQLSSKFFHKQQITDIQFNALMILYDYRNENMHQFELSERLVTNRASTGELIARLEKKNLLKRNQNPLDKRAKFVMITDKGIKVTEKIKPMYYEYVERCFRGFSNCDKKKLSNLIEKFRHNIKALAVEFNQ